MKLRDGREVVADRRVEGARYNIYDCPGITGESERIEWRNDKPYHREGEVGHCLLSLDVDDGVTPMFVLCPDDGRRAASRGYRLTSRQPTAQMFPVRMMWRAPTQGERKRERREGGSHYDQGGLALEWVTAPEAAE